MVVGLIGAGNIAGALARGWQLPLLVTDHGSGRARALAAEVGGEAVASNAELARRADLVVLCHKPAQLAEVAAEVAPHARAVASVLAPTSLAVLAQAYPGVALVRLMPNTAVALGQGALPYTPAPGLEPGLDRELRELFGRLGRVVVLPEGLLEVATGVSGVGPAYLSLVVEAQVDAAVRHGLGAALAAELAVQTMAGTAALLREHDADTLRVRREVASPGGLTARGLAALERAGLRGAFQDAHDAVLEVAR